METILLISNCALLVIAIILIIGFRNKNSTELHLQGKISELQSSLSKIELSLKEDFRINREESATIAKDNRIELNNSLKNIGDQSQNSLKEINNTLGDKLGTLIKEIESNNKTNRE